ncbi:gas vesicle protein GvpO [Streptomyces sp. SAS_270]|uniref:gas vesicle protein GvpO n=1 Tax=Streptomyces sp. SAS_270 TaxID=3412748 RepID=UPI00403D08A7
MSNTSNTSKSRNSQDSPQRESQKESAEESEESQEESEESPERSGKSQERPQEESSRKGASRRKGSDRTKEAAEDQPSAMEVLRQARSQLAELTGMVAESVSSFERTEDGWALEIEVLELVRVPDTMSLLATYQVDLDPRGGLTGYRRVRRYERGRADPHRPGGR